MTSRGRPRSAAAVLAIAAVFSLLLAGCGRKVVEVVATSTPGPAAGAPAARPPDLQQGPDRERDRRSSVKTVNAALETEPVSSSGDAADDIAIWVHPGDAAQSLVFGTDKQGGALYSYGLDGRVVQKLEVPQANNVDLRSGFNLGGESVTLVAVSNRRTDTIAVFRLDVATRRLLPVEVLGAEPDMDIYGLCMYRSERTGRLFVFVTQDDGQVTQQWQVSDAGSGRVRLDLVRSLQVGSVAEGCVADDLLGRLYVAEEEFGIWRYGAEPEDGAQRQIVDQTRGGIVDADVEGLAIYYAGRTAGYLLASSQGDSSYAVYERESNAPVGRFEIGSGPSVDGVEGTDGIDVTNLAAGETFPRGLFIAQDGNNSLGGRLRGHQNFKLVPWEAIAAAFQPPLVIDTARPD